MDAGLEGGDMKPGGQDERDSGEGGSNGGDRTALPDSEEGSVTGMSKTTKNRNGKPPNGLSRTPSGNLVQVILSEFMFVMICFAKG